MTETPIKGHWPKGRPRNPWRRDDWPKLRDELVGFLAAHRKPDERSLRAIAQAVAVDHGTVGKWLRGEIRPPESARGPLREWLKSQRKIVTTKGGVPI